MENFKSFELNSDSIKNLFNEEVSLIEEVLSKDFLLKNGYKQGIIYNYDSVAILNIESMEIEKDNIMEARFFDENKEIVFISDEGEFTGYCIVETSSEMVIKEETEIYSKNFSKLEVKKYLVLDEDGQAYIKYLKPCKLYK